jgi:MFS family permease
LTIRTSDSRRVFATVGALLVLTFSLLLLAYVGFGEARRTYPSLEMAKVAAEGELVQSALQPFLLAGLPLDQFPGFGPLTTPVLQSDLSVARISITDAMGKTVFANTGAAFAGDQAAIESEKYAASVVAPEDARYSIESSATYYQVSLPLKSRLETVGTLHLIVPQARIVGRITNQFLAVLIALIALQVVYALAFIRIERGAPATRARRLATVYGVVYFVMAVVVTGTLLTLFASGIQDKTRALAFSLQQRLDVPLEAGLDLRLFDGLDSAFKDYQRLNPDLSFVALTSGSKVIISTDPQQLNTTWHVPSGQFDYDLNLQSATASGANYAVHVAIPKGVVYGQLWRTAKNFIALFVASTLISTLFFRLIASYRRLGTGTRAPVVDRALQLDILEPVYFLAVFADALTKSFLPVHFSLVATGTHVSPGLVATLFTVYFFAYAVALFPSGRFAERHDYKILLVVGASMEALSLLSLAFIGNFYVLYAVQAVTGLGQGILFSGTQAAVLHLSTPQTRIRGQAIIATGFNGGVLSGAAIGALLAADPALGQSGVFLVGGTVVVLTVCFALLLVRRLEPERVEPGNLATGGTSLWKGLAIGLRDVRFLEASILVGIPSKLVTAGVISATLPLLLAQQHYATEDIGQIIMLYSGGVLISTHVVARIAHRFQDANTMLFLGSVGSGVGLVFIGLMGWSALTHSVVPHLGTIILVVGLSVVGLMHGFIQTPIIHYLSSTRITATLGTKSTIAMYRVFERVGNVAGPILVGQIVLLSGGSSVGLSWIGGVIMAFGLLFVFDAHRTVTQARTTESFAATH